MKDPSWHLLLLMPEQVRLVWFNQLRLTRVLFTDVGFGAFVFCSPGLIENTGGMKDCMVGDEMSELVQ